MITFDSVGFRYGVGPEVLHDVSMTLEPGSFHFLTGASGAGKSTLLNLMNLSLRPTRGFASLFGHDLADIKRRKLPELRRRIGVVFQDFRLLNHLSAFDNVALPLRLERRRDRDIRRDVTEILEWVGLGDALDAGPRALSGGEQQRVAIARAVITHPNLLLADEPTGSVDDATGERIMRLFEQLNRLGTSVVIATHSTTLIDRFPHPVLTLRDGILHGLALLMARIPLQPETRAAQALALTVTALMVALGMLALTGALASHTVETEWRASLADRWTAELTPADPEKPVPAAAVDRAVATLRATPGIAEARAIGPDEIRHLLEPLFDNVAVTAELPLPVLIDIAVDPAARPAASSVASRLASAVPGAKLDDHGAWTHDLTRLAETGEAVGIALLGIIALVAAFGISASVRARLAVNRAEIELLHIMGASDFYIARQFQASAFRLAIAGSVIGAILAAGATIGLIAVVRSFGTILPAVTVAPSDWAVLAVVPLAAILLAATVARSTALMLGSETAMKRLLRFLLRNLIELAIVLVVIAIPLVIGFVWFAENLPPPTADTTKTDAIVVLTGGSDRFSTGINLLTAGMGKRLFVSGVHQGVDVPELLKIAHAASAPGLPLSELAAKIDLGHDAGDTFGNAVETAAWMQNHQFHTMRLVTADYHMRRALIEFRLDAPEIDIVPNPVQPPNTGTGRWWRDRATLNLLLSEYGKYVIARWRYSLARLMDKTT